MALALEVRGEQLSQDEQQRRVLGTEWLYLRIGGAQRAEEGAIGADDGGAGVRRDGGIGGRGGVSGGGGEQQWLDRAGDGVSVGIL